MLTSNEMDIYHNKPEDVYGVKNLWMLANKSIRMEGFICDMNPERAQALEDKVIPLLISGRCKALQDITVGIEHAPEGLAGVFTGKNFGKALLKIADPNI